MNPIRIAIADDDAGMRLVMRKLAERAEGYELVGEAADGKEIIARDNEVSVLRKEDLSKAYLNCHTDITIPYDELDSIIAIEADGTEHPIILDGKFVVPGTEELNRPLE